MELLGGGKDDQSYGAGGRVGKDGRSRAVRVLSGAQTATLRLECLLQQANASRAHPVQRQEITFTPSLERVE